MLLNIILLFITLLILTLLLNYSKNSEAFTEIPGHTDFIEKSTKKLNSLTNLINLPDPSISVTPITQNDVDKAITNLKQDAGSLVPTVKYTLPENLPDTLKKAKACEVLGPTCSAFDDKVFAQNCGVSFDINGVGSDGKPHMGGMFISTEDRNSQVARAQNVLDTGSAPYDHYKVYQPTIGTSAPATFGITKDSCVVVKEKVDCKAKQTFGSPNCTQCYTSQDFARVGPDTQRIPFKLYISGNGAGLISNSNFNNTNSKTKPITDLQNNSITLSPKKATKYTLAEDSEGLMFYVKCSINKELQQSGTPYICGYIEGSTPRGTFKLDIIHLVYIVKTANGEVIGKKPRISGTTLVNGFKCINAINETGTTEIGIGYIIPFSFLSMYDGDALTCDNGPIITKAASATFLESDPCYGKANQPGNYKLECLQSRWIEMGGTQEGTGYPFNQKNADAIQKDENGNPLNIETIVDNLSEIMIKALTGKTQTGQLLTIPEWNTASMYATGVPINTPCDGPGGVPPLSQQCLSYLYANKGTSSHIGSTYTLPAPQYGHTKEGFESYAYNNTRVSPDTDTGLEFGQSLGGINDVKNMYDSKFMRAMNNDVKNEERSSAILDMFGLNLGSAAAKKKDFDIRIAAGQNTKSYDDLTEYCKSKNQRVCESSEICDMATRTVTNPELTSEFPGDNWIAVGDQQNEWLTLNRADNRYCKTHTEVAGYLPEWGSNRNPSGWERLVKCCGNDLQIQGRYIKLQYTRQDCLNLAQISVYSQKNGANLITTNTTVTKSSVWGGGDYIAPSKNFVDGIGLSLVHTSCGDVPWIQVDLGEVVPIYKVVIMNRTDCCKERILGSYLSISDETGSVYTSKPISTVNTSYSWYPPKTDVRGDVPGDEFKRPRQWVHGDNGTVSCNTYCKGTGGGPWNGELPYTWNGAQCVGYDPVIGGCDKLFTNHSGAGCLCERTGYGWK